jgi:hypothetical protein
MHKIRIFTYFFLAAVLVAGAFVCPRNGQAAGPSEVGPMVITVEVNIITKPPAWMCLNESTPINFTYVLKTYVERGVAKTPYPTALVFLDAKADHGTLSKSSFLMDRKTWMGSGTTTFKATQEGLATIQFLTNGTVQLTGHYQTETTVEKCDHTLVIDADDMESAESGEISSAIYGQGGINVDEMGIVTGGGPFQYFLGVYFNPPQTAFKCNSWVQVDTDSTFAAMGKAPGDRIELVIDFTPFHSKDLVAHCSDNAGRTYTFDLVKGRDVDPNHELNLGTLSWSNGQGLIHFKYGKGDGYVWLMKRQGGKK